MFRRIGPLLCALPLLPYSGLRGAEEVSRLPIPDKLVVLTFDDGNKSDLITVAPLLKKYGFGASFFITSGWLGSEQRLTWAGARQLQEQGFEIGCHTVSHPNLLPLTGEEIRRQIKGFDRACAENKIAKPVSFSYPGGHFDRRVLAILQDLGYAIARRGRDPERPLDDKGGNGRAYVPGEDHPFLIPSTMTRGIGAQEDDRIVQALAEARSGRVTVLTYHGVPDVNRHCSTPVERFCRDMEYLKKSGATVIALRDLSRYVDLGRRPGDPFAPIVRRLGLRVQEPGCDNSGAVPQFSWRALSSGWTQEQVAYRLLVASSKTLLDRGEGDLWDSGKVTSTERKVIYDGPTLAAGRTCWWKVQLWNRRDSAEIARITPYQSEEMITELHKSRSGPFSEASSFTVRPRR